MYIVFKGTVFTWNLKSKLLIQIEDELHSLLSFLIYKLKYDLQVNLIDEDFLYTKNKKFFVTRIPGFNKNNEYVIFTKFYNFTSFNKIPIHEVPNKFNGIFLMKIKKNMLVIKKMNLKNI